MISFFSQQQTVVSDTHRQRVKVHHVLSVNVSALKASDLKSLHTFFVLRVAVSFLLLLPGLNQHGIITKYAGMAKREINKLMKQKEKKNE